MVAVIGSAGIRVTHITDHLARDIGRDISSAFQEAKIDTDSITRATETIRRHELDLARARQQVAEQQRRLSDAEVELIQLRKAEEPDIDAITAAELRLARAHAEVAVATDRVSASTRKLDEAHRQHALALRVTTQQVTHHHQQTNNLVRSEDAHTRSLRDVAQMFGKLVPNIGGANRVGAAFGGVLRGIGTAAAYGFAELTLMAGAQGVAGLVSALGAASGVGLAVPGLLAGAAVGVTTLTVGLQGLGDAFKALDDPEKLKEELKDLAPAAAEFVLAVRDLSPEFKALRQSVQQQLLSGVARDFTTLSRTYIPELRSGLGGVAREINLGGDALVRFAKEKQTIADTRDLFRNTAAGAHLLADAARPALEALRDIGTVGSDFLPELSGQVDKAAHSFAAFIADARESGQLQEWFTQAKDAVAEFGEGLGNIVSAVSGVFNAASGSGASFLDSFVHITDTIDGWVHSFEGQRTLFAFFDSARQAIDAVLPVLSVLAQVFGQQVAPILAMIATAVGPAFVVLVQAIGDALEVARPGIEALADGFAAFLEGIAPALPAIGGLAKVLGETLGKVLADLGPVLNDVLTALSDALSEIISDPEFQQALSDLVRSFGDLLIALAPLLPVLANIAIKFLPVLVDLFDALVPIIEALIPFVELLGPPLEALAFILERIVEGVGIFAEDIEFFVNQTADALGLGAERFSGTTDLMSAAFGKTTDDIHNSSWRIKDILREVTDSAGVAGDGLAGTAGLIGSAFFTTQVNVENAVGGMLRAVQKAHAPMGVAGSALGTAFAGGVQGGAKGATGGLIAIINSLYSQITGNRGRWAQAGSSLGLSFANGLAGNAVMAAIRASANKVMAAAGSFLPSSPAKEGPFSGRGWTFYRGQALMVGFINGIYDTIPGLRLAARTAVASLRLPTGGDLLASHPELFSPRAPAAGGRRSVATLDATSLAAAVHAGMLAAAEQLTVTVSAGEVTRVVNSTNKSNAGRQL